MGSHLSSMDIYINRDGQQGGPYSLDKINECLAQRSMEPTDLAFHEGLPDWIPLSQVNGVILGGVSPVQSTETKPEGGSIVSPKPNNTGKILVFGGIAVSLIAVCVTVWFFVFEWGKKESPQKKVVGFYPKTKLPSPMVIKTNGNPVKPKTQPPKVVSINLATMIEEAIRSALDKPTGELTTADLEVVRELYMPHGELNNLEPLAGLANLEELSLFNNQITNLMPLAGLKGLKRLIIYDNPDLTKTEIDKLQQALPKCEIIHNATKF